MLDTDWYQGYVDELDDKPIFTVAKDPDGWGAWGATTNNATNDEHREDEED
jgi:hypothetical protein